MNNIWQEFLKIIHEEVGSRVVETWFKAVQFYQWDAPHKTAYLRAPNQFVKDWLTSHYQHLFHQHLGRLLNEKEIRVTFIESVQTTVTPAVVVPSQITEPTKIVPHRPSMALIQKNPRTRDSLNPHYSFDSFVVGPHNKLAFAAANAVTEKPGRLYNPLFIYGSSGLGKTHLLHAIGNHIKKQARSANILYQSADRFVNEFINAIRFDKVYQFETRYKDVDVLLVDDIQFISNKEQTQEAFFHIFNTLHQAHKQIVFTSDSLPCDIAGLAERMRSRLEGGLIADIQLPKLETKIAILRKKAELNNEHLSDEVANFIASHVTSNVRELEGALIRIFAFASLTKQSLTIELAQKVLLRNKTTQQQTLDLHHIATKVAAHFDYTLQEIRSNKRNKDLTLARHVALYFMKKLTTRSLKEIGSFLERKDHSTVIHAYEKIEQYKKNNNPFIEKLSRIEQEITR